MSAHSNAPPGWIYVPERGTYAVTVERMFYREEISIFQWEQMKQSMGYDAALNYICRDFEDRIRHNESEKIQVERNTTGGLGLTLGNRTCILSPEETRILVLKLTRELEDGSIRLIRIPEVVEVKVPKKRKKRVVMV